jgi:hypothetical protein
MRRLAALVLATTGYLSCSINGTRSLGQDCLQNRECASGLSCQPRPDGRYVCQPVSEGGTVFVTDANDDTGPDSAIVDAATTE